MADYFAINDRRDALPLFSPDAEVSDEGEIHKGIDAIHGWLDSVERRYQPWQTAETAITEEGRTIVTFTVSGNFPGSPATLRPAFTLSSDGKIASLVTL